ncbi:MAG: molybdopterin molybdotransferase MoeA [Desulfurococcales archaeon]|nr:molybdopterin molybdotransferase MoeA [Desulfurococcales archaeon]
MGYNVIEKLHSVEDARRLLDRVLDTPREERAPLLESLGRVSSRRVTSPTDIPPYNRSVLDGYAARWIDVSLASEEAPARLRLAGRIDIDEGSPPRIEPNTCYEVATGSPLPEGADVVIPIEYAEARGGYVNIYKGFPGGYGVSLQGEDLRAGDLIIDRGEVVGEWHIGVLASVGMDSVNVWSRFRVAVVSTGRELIEPGARYTPGKVYASTGRLVVAYLRARGVDARYYGILPDSEEEIARFILDALERHDAVMTTGGTSVGRGDATIRALKSISEDLIHGLALTPGRPGAVAVVRGKPVMALSGMPVAAVSELIAVWDPVYRGKLGRSIPWEQVVRGRMTRPYSSHPGMMNVVRTYSCIEGDRVKVTPLRVTGSGILSTLIKANSIMIIPEDVTGIEEGEEVEVLLTGPLAGCRGDGV